MQLTDPIEAFYSIPKAYCPKASPNGEWVVCNWNKTGYFELHAIHVASGEHRQLTAGDLPLHPEEATYRWDAGSDAILYQVDRNEATDVYRTALDGPVTRLFTVNDSIHLWAINPETGTIYYRVGVDTLRWRDPTTGESGDFPNFQDLVSRFRRPVRSVPTANGSPTRRSRLPPPEPMQPPTRVA